MGLTGDAPVALGAVVAEVLPLSAESFRLALHARTAPLRARIDGKALVLGSFVLDEAMTVKNSFKGIGAAANVGCHVLVRLFSVNRFVKPVEQLLCDFDVHAFMNSLCNLEATPKGIAAHVPLDPYLMPWFISYCMAHGVEYMTITND